MIPVIIFLLSIGLQLTAAVIALLLIRITGRKLAWILIAIAMVLMASHRIVTFISLLSAGKEITFEIPELIALVISFLMLFGVLRIGEYFRSIHLAKEALHESENRYRTLVETSTDAIYEISPEGVLTMLNLAFEKITGWSRSEWIGKQFMPMVHPDDLPTALEKMQRVFLGETQFAEFRILSRSGEYWVAELTGIPFVKGGKVEGLFGFARDITERKRIEGALRENEALYRTLVETSPYSIVLADLSGRITFCNQQTLRSHGFASMDDILGTSCFDLFAPEYRQRAIDAAQQALIDGGFRNIEYTLIRRDSSRFPAETSASLIINEEGKPQGFIGILWDITERKKLEEQLRHTQKMQAIGQLAGGVAHEFNNILTTIIGYGDMLLMKMREDDPLRHNVEQILTSSERAANLTQGLLAYSRKQATILKPVSLNEIIKKTEGLLMKIVSEDIEFRTVIAEEDPTVMADRGQIEQVLVNIATNAKDAMPDGGVLTIEIQRVKDLDIRTLSGGKINKSPEIEKDFAGIFVTDTGIGIDKDIEERIFDPFFTTKDIGKGTGLGLAIVYGIIKQHGGYINVYSEPDKGTTFKIYLPIIRSKIEEEAKPLVISLPAGGKEMVLIAEDDKALRALIKTVLSEFGYKVIDAVDGEDAVEKFIQNKDEINLVILDVIMPKKNGKEVYEEIKKIKPEIKAIFSSGYTADIIHKKGIIEEGIDFILKPVSPKDLLKKVREVLDR